MTIDQFCDVLRKFQISGVDQFQKKLRDNASISANLEDLVCEGRVALTFAQYGWQVTMRESPDVEVRRNGIVIGIEVKHFRRKPSHDPIEERMLREQPFVYTQMPRLIETEGHEEDYDQMFRFAVKYARQLIDGERNILFFWCSTVAHSDITLLTAANIYEEALEKPSCDPKMFNLSAMMICAIWGSVGYNGGHIFWKPIWRSTKPVSVELKYLLEEISN